MKLIYKFPISILFLILCSFSVQAQTGNHLLLSYNLENTGWAMDNYQRVTTTNTYPELSYYMTWGSGKGGGTAEFYAPGIFSGVGGNVYITSDDDSLQITNINMLGFVMQHFIFSTNDETHNFGWSWGIDFLGHSLASGAEEGSFDGLDKAGAQEHAQLEGMGVHLGATYQFNLEDKILVDGYVLYQMVYNSQLAQTNGKSFHGKGLRTHFRGRYYLNDSWVAHSDLMIQSITHDPNDITVSNVGGKMSYMTFSIGIGYQW